jgi:hypothetical protein
MIVHNNFVEKKAFGVSLDKLRKRRYQVERTSGVIDIELPLIPVTLMTYLEEEGSITFRRLQDKILTFI